MGLGGDMGIAEAIGQIAISSTSTLNIIGNSLELGTTNKIAQKASQILQGIGTVLPIALTAGFLTHSEWCFVLSAPISIVGFLVLQQIGNESLKKYAAIAIKIINIAAACFALYLWAICPCSLFEGMEALMIIANLGSATLSGYSIYKNLTQESTEATISADTLTMKEKLSCT